MGDTPCFRQEAIKPLQHRQYGLPYLHWRRLVKEYWGDASQNLGRKMVITDESLHGRFPIIGARARAAPKVYAYDYSPRETPTIWWSGASRRDWHAACCLTLPLSSPPVPLPPPISRRPGTRFRTHFFTLPITDAQIFILGSYINPYLSCRIPISHK